MKGFDPAAKAFSAANALGLGRAADLAYSDGAAVEAGLARWGMSGVFLDVVVPPDGDTQAFVAADGAKVVLAFRGTKDVLDFVTDARFAQEPFGGPGKIAGKVHAGFLRALDVAWPRVRAAVAAARDRGQTLWATGHSLGGALATLAVARLRNEGIPVDGLYTFGSPTVGDEPFAASFDRGTEGRVFRFVNDLDIVARCPPEGVPYLPPYRHSGTAKYFDRHGALADSFDPFRAASVVRAAALVALKGGKVPRDRLKRELLTSLKEPLADHGMAGYLANLEAAVAAPPAPPPEDGLAELLGDIAGIRGLWKK